MKFLENNKKIKKENFEAPAICDVTIVTRPHMILQYVNMMSQRLLVVEPVL